VERTHVCEKSRDAEPVLAALEGVELPDLLTVEEAARILRIGRTSAYALAARFEETKGADGLPVVRIGRLLRVPRAALEALMGGPITRIPASGTRTALISRSDSAPTNPSVEGEQLTFPPTAA
jgi:excisionase family DNA binding protein